MSPSGKVVFNILGQFGGGGGQQPPHVRLCKTPRLIFFGFTYGSTSAEYLDFFPGSKLSSGSFVSVRKLELSGVLSNLFVHTSHYFYFFFVS